MAEDPLEKIKKARNYATNPSLVVQFMNLVEDAGLVKLAGHPEAHIPFNRAFRAAGLGFPFVPDWILWLFILLSLVYSLLALHII